MHSAGLRIGIFTDDFYPESGGVSRSIQVQIQELSKAGHLVTLFAPAFNFVPPTECAWESIPYWRIPGTPSFLCGLQTQTALASRIARDHPHFDLVHSQNERGSVFLAAKVARELAIPQIHTFHSNYVGTHHTTPRLSGLNSLTYLDWSGRMLRRVTQDKGFANLPPPPPGCYRDGFLAVRDWRSLARIASAVDRFTSPADFMIEGIHRVSGYGLANRAKVVPGGVAGSFTSAKRHRPFEPITRFVSAGRLGPEKRVHVLLDAFASLGRDDVELCIIGTGIAERALRRQASTITHGTVRFLGHFTNLDRLAQELADADVFVLASHGFETQGTVLAEAAAAGTPILYCDDRLHVGVSPENALLTGSSASELAAGMSALADNPARRSAMAAASTAMRTSLCAEMMHDSYVDLYREAVAEYR